MNEDQLAMLVFAFKDIVVDKDENLDYLKLYGLRIPFIINRLKSIESTMTEEGINIANQLIDIVTSPP